VGRVSNPGRGKTFFSSPNVSSGALCPEARSSPIYLCNAAFKNKWNHIFTSPYAVVSCAAITFALLICFVTDLKSALSSKRSFYPGFHHQCSRHFLCLIPSTSVSWQSVWTFLSCGWHLLFPTCSSALDKVIFFIFLFVLWGSSRNILIAVQIHIFPNLLLTSLPDVLNHAVSTGIQSRSESSAVVAYYIIRIPK
jgi:hypothetical protein